MTSLKDYLTDTDILQKLTDNIICSVGAEPDGHKLKINTTDELIEIIKPFLTESIQQSMEVGRENGYNKGYNEGVFLIDKAKVLFAKLVEEEIINKDTHQTLKKREAQRIKLHNLLSPKL